MQHFLLDSALGICFSILGKAYPEIAGLTAEASVEEDSENNASVNLILLEPRHRNSFAIIEVNLSIFPLERRTLGIEIFAELEDHEMEGLTNFRDVDVQSIIEQYEYLQPIITEGMTHYGDNLSNPKKPIRKVSRTMTVRYRIHDENYEEDEDSTFNYDTNKIAESAIPYLKSLLDIQNKHMIEFKSGEE